MRRFAKETLKRWVRVVLHTDDSPERTSLAFAVGVFIAFLPPVPYFHTLFALLVAFVFRLNRVAVLIGSYVNTPFTMAPVLFVELSIGLAFFGGGEAPDITWRQLSTWQGWKDAGVELQPLVAPLMVGCIVLALAASVVAYVIALKLISRYRRRLMSTAKASPSSDEGAVSASGPLGGVSLPGLRPPMAGGLTPNPGSQAASTIDPTENRS